MASEQEASLTDAQKQIGNVIVGIVTTGKLKLVYHVEDSSLGLLPENFGILLSPPNTAFTLFGKAYVSYIYGTPMECMGTEISAKFPGPQAVFSPTTHAPLAFHQRTCLSTDIADNDNDVPNSFDFSGLATVLKSVFDSVTPSFAYLSELVVDVYNAMGPNCSVLLFRSFVSRVSDSMQNVKRFENLFALTHKEHIQKSISQRLGFSVTMGDAASFHSSAEMSNLAERFMSNASADSPDDAKKSMRLLLAGPKSAGKSSLLRFLINRFVTQSTNRQIPPRIAVLDCDIGQPEFTPCGMVSLTIVTEPILGPPFTHHLKKSPNPIW